MADRLCFIIVLLPSKRSELVVDVADVLRYQGAVLLSFFILDVEEVLVILFQNLLGGNSSKYLGAHPLHCWS